MNTQALPEVALIAGPTASGKSALALALAETRGGTVINADSAQVYRDLRVLSARPTPDEEARAEHRLFGWRDAAEPCSAADWAVAARREIDRAVARGKLPVLVGGTGLYLHTLLDGIAPVPEIVPTVREAVRSLPLEAAYAALEREDREAAERLRPRDGARIARALEVVRSTGRTLATWQAERVGGISDRIRLRPLVLLPDRAALHERCDRRLVRMFDEGAVEEVRALLARLDVPADAPVLRAIGVPEIGAFLAGDIDRNTATERTQIATRRYAKRQYTWFRHQPPADWPRLAAFGEDVPVDDWITSMPV